MIIYLPISPSYFTRLNFTFSYHLIILPSNFNKRILSPNLIPQYHLLILPPLISPSFFIPIILPPYFVTLFCHLISTPKVSAPKFLAPFFYPCYSSIHQPNAPRVSISSKKQDKPAHLRTHCLYLVSIDKERTE